ESSTVNKATPGLTTTASGPVTVGAAIHDTAHLTGGFAPLGGTVSFSVYAPGDTTCQTPLTPAPTSATVNGAGHYDSGNFTTTAVGYYRWIAHYSGDAKNNAVDTACNDDNESSTVNPAGPTIETTQDPAEATVGDDLNDSAMLSGGVDPQGTITLNLYGPDNPTCNSEAATAVDTESVSADGNGTSSTPDGL